MGHAQLGALTRLLVFAQLAAPAPAEPTSVRVVAPCAIADAPLDSVLDILRAQLAPLTVNAAPVEAATPDVEVTLDACRTTGAALELVVRYHDARYARRIDLGDVDANGRSRTLALTLAEAVKDALARRGEIPPVTAAFSPELSTSPVTSGDAAPPASTEPPRLQKPSAREPSDSSRSVVDDDFREPVGFTLQAAPIVRYVFNTSTPYFGLDAGAHVRRYGIGLRLLASHRDTEGGAVWQGAGLAVFGVDWLRLATRASVRSELELGVALAVPKPSESTIGHDATSLHVGGSTGLRLISPLSRHWSLASGLGVGLASSLTSQARHQDLMSLSGVFLQASLEVSWRAAPERAE